MQAAEKSRFGLPAGSVAAMQSVLARHAAVRRALIFGSRAKGNYRAGSDIDLTLVGEALNSADLLAISGEIDDLNLPYKVDLSLFEHIEDSALLDHIARVGEALYVAEPHAPRTDG